MMKFDCRYRRTPKQVYHNLRPKTIREDSHILEAKSPIEILSKYTSNNTLKVLILPRVRNATKDVPEYDYIRDLTPQERKELYTVIENVVRESTQINNKHFKVHLKYNKKTHRSIQRKIIAQVFRGIEIEGSEEKFKCQYYVCGDEIIIGKMRHKKNFLDILFQSFEIFGYLVYFDLRVPFLRITKQPIIPEGSSIVEVYEMRFDKLK